MPRTRDLIDQNDATIPENGKCMICETGTLKPAVTRRNLSVVRCSTCGLAVGRMKTDSTMNEGTVVATDPGHFKLLVADYPKHLAMTADLLDARLVAYVRRLGAKPRLWLEIGPGNGALADILPQHGYRWTGVEFDPEMARMMRDSGKNVISGDFSAIDPATLMGDAERENGGFDIVTFSQVFEHVLEPRAFLRNAWAALRPGGLLHVDVPNHNGLTALIRRVDLRALAYGEIVPPHHMIGYGRRTLRIALEQAGFEIVDLFSCANDHPVFGLVHAHLETSPRMRAVWALSRFAGGGNLVALARKPR